jgi:YHS domain-containing protein
MRRVIAGLLILGTTGFIAKAGPADEVPPPFQPFEHMIGGWKGTATPASNPRKGWQESHGWSWKFEKGKPVGLTITFEGGKTLVKAAMSYDESTKKYKLNGTDPQGKAIGFVGGFTNDGKTLTFDRLDATPEGKERVVIRPNSNKIRYTFQIDRQEPGAPQYKSVVTIGLTKDGESFAAGAGGADLPKCIMTGGAAGMSVSYQGKSYPVCCTGCKDEFNDNPAKYAKIADLAAAANPSKDKTGAKPAAKGKDDGSFDGLFDEDKPKSAAMPKTATKDKDKDKAKPSTPPAEEPAADSKTAKPKSDAETKASRDLQLGQSFEKVGKNSIALTRYKKLIKDYPDTEAAKTAAARVKALEAK